jgi:hypothetical protein
VLVLGLPFWDVPIDGGSVGTAEIKQRGYQTRSYPVEMQEEVISTVIWTEDELPALVDVLEDLRKWLPGELPGVAA